MKRTIKAATSHPWRVDGRMSAAKKWSLAGYFTSQDRAEAFMAECTRDHTASPGRCWSETRLAFEPAPARGARGKR